MRVDFFNCLLCDELDVRAYTRREVEGRLRESGLDYLDQFMLGALDPGHADPIAHPRSMMEDAFDELYRMRDEGKIRFVGFSCHSPNHAAKILQAFPNFDSVMSPYNFANREAEGDLSEALAKTGAARLR
jgi:aryl-alcohol dehydrogenase-like predicted oxidoreductase